MSTIITTMEELISKYKPDENLVAVCYKLLQSAAEDELPTLLKHFFVCYDDKRHDLFSERLRSFAAKKENSALSALITNNAPESLPQFFGNGEIVRSIGRFGYEADQKMEELVKASLPEERFYSLLWKYLNEDSPMTTDAERTAVLMNWANDVKLPYYYYGDTMKLSRSELSACLNELGTEKIKKMKRIIASAQFEHYHEKSSLLLDMLDGIEDRKLKCVFLAEVLRYA